MEDVFKDSFWRWVTLTGQAMRSYADQQLKKYDLTVEQLHVLKQADVAGGQAQHELSLLTSKSPANMTRMLDRLEKKNRIVRRPNPDDRRSSLIFLTEDGKQLKDEVINLFYELRIDLVDGIETEKQMIAIEVLKTIQKNIEKMSEK